MNKIVRILNILILCIATTSAIFAQAVLETIDAHILDGTYENIEGVWGGSYFSKEYGIGGVESAGEININFYKENGVFKGLSGDDPNDHFYELKKGKSSASYIFQIHKSGVKYISGSGELINETSLKLMLEYEYFDKYGRSLRCLITYSLKKEYPLQDDFLAIIEQQQIDKGSKITGSGFAISSDGVIVTNYHVIDNASSIKAKGINGNFNKSYTLEVLQVDKFNDLAILKITDDDFRSIDTIPYNIKNSSSEVGEDVFVLGFPLTATMGDEVKLTTGVISSRTGFLGNVSHYQISAPIQSGNSGGPLFDKKGNVIGVINAKYVDAENVSYAIKAIYLQNIIDLLPKNISTPNSTTLVNKTLSEQVKIIRDFIFIIEVATK